jgi:hypothetical protein
MFLGTLDAAESLVASVYETERRTRRKDQKTLRSRHLLAMLQERRGLEKEAEQAYLETLAAQRELLGDENDDTMATINSLAALYRDLGRGAEAETLMRELIEISSRKFGEEDPKTLICRHNLARVCRGMGRYERPPRSTATSRDQDPRPRRRPPETLRTKSNLAGTYFLGRLDGRWRSRPRT